MSGPTASLATWAALDRLSSPDRDRLEVLARIEADDTITPDHVTAIAERVATRGLPGALGRPRLENLSFEFRQIVVHCVQQKVQPVPTLEIALMVDPQMPPGVGMAAGHVGIIDGSLAHQVGGTG